MNNLITGIESVIQSALEEYCTLITSEYPQVNSEKLEEIWNNVSYSTQISVVFNTKKSTNKPVPPLPKSDIDDDDDEINKKCSYKYQKGKNKGLVLSTDNLTEYLLGFFTIFGDQGDFGPIQNLWKTQVYGMSELMANQFKETNQSKIWKVIEESQNKEELLADTKRLRMLEILDFKFFDQQIKIFDNVGIINGRIQAFSDTTYVGEVFYTALYEKYNNT
jgi:hypothetical protein